MNERNEFRGVFTMSKKVAVIMGSDSDFPTVSAAVKKLKSFGVPVEVHVMSAHRTPPVSYTHLKLLFIIEYTVTG